MKRLIKCNSLEDIQNTAVDFQINKRLAPAHSQLAFRHLLQTRCRTGVPTKTNLNIVLQFLGISSLNNPEAQNIKTLFRWYAEQDYGHRNMRYLIEWLKLQISLGCLDEQELLALVQTVASSRKIVRNDYYKGALILAISESLKQSTVYQIHDVNATTLNVLLESMASSNLSQKMQLSGFKILRSLHESQLQHMKHGISCFLRACLLAEKSDQQEQIGCIDQISNVSEFLQTLPNQIMISIITETSKELIRCITSISAEHSSSSVLFDAWCSFLTQKDIFQFLKHEKCWHEFELELVDQDIGTVGLYLQNLSHEEKNHFLRRTWLSPTKIAGGIYYPLIVAAIETSLRKPFLAFSSIQSTFNAIFRLMGTRVSTMGAKLSSLLQIMDRQGMDKTVLAIIHCLQERNIPVDYQVIISQIKKHVYTYPHIAYYLFKRTRLLPLESCPAVAEVMIYNARFNPDTALLYRHQRRNFLQVFESQHEITQARIELLRRMAIAYANSSFLFPRVAFRQVYMCYRLHRQYNLGPLSVEISSALTIAGIVRPLQESKWTGTEKVRWILRIVREVEGDAVATRVDELVYTWRGLLHREMERQREKAWRDGTSEIPNEEVKAEKRERQRRHFRGRSSPDWTIWGKDRDEPRIRKVLWTLDLITSCTGTHPPSAIDPDGPAPLPPCTGPASASASASASAAETTEPIGTHELDRMLGSDIVLLRELERFRDRARD